MSRLMQGALPDVRKYAFDTELRSTQPWGLFIGGRVMCSDGKVRALSQISATADTFFSVPAKIKVMNRTITGFVTVETADGWTTETPDDPAVAKFGAYSSGKNADLIPDGLWRRNSEEG